MNRMRPLPETDPESGLRPGNPAAGAGRHHRRHRARHSNHSSLIASACIVFIALALVALFYQAATVMIPLVLATFASMMLKPPVRWLAKAHISSPLGAALVVAVAVFTLGAAITYMGRPALEWVEAAPENLPRLREKFRGILRPAARLSDAAARVGTLDQAEDPTRHIQAVEVQDHRVAQIVFSWTGGLLAGVGETVGLVFLLLAFGDGFVHKMIAVLPTVPDKKQAIQIHHDVQDAISTYLFSVGLINLGFGILVGVVLQLLEMPNALMWGGVAAVLNFVPYFGPVVGILAVAVAGLLSFETISLGLVPSVAYLVFHLIEANWITPYILGRRFILNPVIIFVALIFWAWLWGIIGALLAVPMLVALKVICEHLPAYSSVHRLISSED